MVNKKPPPDDRVVYLAFKHVFKGQDAGIRNPKPTKKLINQHQKQDLIADLIREHTLDVLCGSVQRLLSQEIFASTLKAKIRFPELFDPSPAQNAEREASKAEAARNDVEAISEMAESQLDATVVPVLHEPPVVQLKGKNPALSATNEPADSKVTSKGSARTSRLFPIYLPMKVQYRLLTHLQAAMERACYDYAKQTIPDVLSERQLDCAEAVELNRWTNELMKRTSMMGSLDSSNTSIDKILRSITDLRHTAVHRQRVSAKAIEQFLLDAEALSTLFGIKVHIEEISSLRRSFQASIEELERNKHFLQSRLDEALQQIADQRAELQRMEEIAVSNMIKEDHEYQGIAGKIIEESITVSDRSENAFSTVVVTERGEMRGGQNNARNGDSDSGGGSGTEEHYIGGWRHEFSDWEETDE